MNHQGEEYQQREKSKAQDERITKFQSLGETQQRNYRPNGQQANDLVKHGSDQSRVTEACLVGSHVPAGKVKHITGNILGKLGPSIDHQAFFQAGMRFPKPH